MAACKLVVELDDPTRRRVGGEVITGTVVVKSDKDVNCKSLNVTSLWSTHGRGNIASGDVDTSSLFQGTWLADQEYRYPFKLVTATWPPTYSGHYLNVGHYVEARANVPWSIDPKTQTEFLLSPNETPPDLAPSQNATKKTNWIIWLIGLVFGSLLLLAIVPLALLLVPIIGIGAAGFWFFTKFLPSLITGTVQLKVEPNSLTAGETLRGTCEFTPLRNSVINGVTWTISCNEICVSGSGSNRTTHKHEILNKVVRLLEAGPLQSGKTQRFDLSFDIPKMAPPSLKFSDNEVTWTSELRIDIPKWPDWKKSVPFIVIVEPSKSSDPATNAANASATFVDDEPWLTEVLQQVIQSQDDPDRLETVLSAISDQSFPISVDIQGQVDEPLESDIEESGLWAAAVDKARDIRFVLFIPSTIGGDELFWSNDWKGAATVAGFQSETSRVMMRLIN